MSLVSLLSEERGSKWGREGEKEEKSEAESKTGRKSPGNQGTEAGRDGKMAETKKGTMEVS